ncbi:AraC family transcriptional regulator [Neptunomonas phycophila]|jgi:AraC-like DNA-binding protein|uniref:AraC family transcriptional regulator n=1 Tax=Neptunomonas phycophila TaxID=1572645 RepID=A0ABT9ERB8_9GAMM|nr:MULTISPECIES: AraC family transcriptional regulator [Neptunomonas]MBT3146948.1 AraC family transcriptional regulator [Neptunomonas phycophila]MDN2661312.1 AraC family transcriptional regulator [Neptunomonas sp. CHC150]MDO6783593.1 AraC family transcriptional regulator [Neptunomonas phycophila]MDP2521623.1 AraC family transcriptional regulator [Neptunomonas phycophila]
MSQPSDWPLPPDSSRFVVPRKMVSLLSQHPLAKDLYPLGLGYYKQALNHTMSRNKHDDYLMIYCLDGEGKLTINNQIHTVKAGDIICLPKGVAHAYKASEATPWTIYWVHFSGDKSEDFIDYLAINSNNYVFPLGIHSRLTSDFESLLECRQYSYNINAFVHTASLLRQILTHIAQLQPLAKQQAAHNFDLERVHSLMQARVHEQLELEALAETVSLSKFHFIKKYKELTGTTPINHFIHLKVERACHLLDVTTKSINEISFAVGYEDAYYFSRIFKKIMGISPSQYRRMRMGTFPYTS